VYSDYIVYVDESGDHGLTTCDPHYPVFVLAFCLFDKTAYVEKVVPALQYLKFKHFGHDMSVLHEHEIRKASGDFSFLIDATKRQTFMDDLSRLVRDAPFTVIAVVVDKRSLQSQYVRPINPYHIGLAFGLERVEKVLRRHGQTGRTTHVIFESRGKKEDDELELEFRRVRDGANYLGTRLSFEIAFADKRSNSCGLQLADLIARPIGRKVLEPTQANRAYDIIEQKLERGPSGQIDGWGLKRFP
jgi:hypothetical protein